MLKKIFRRVRKAARDIGSFAKENSGIANPELALMALTLGASGIMPGGKPFGLKTLFGNLGRVVGGFDKVVPGGKAMGNVLQQGTGILGGAQDIFQSLSGKEKVSGILSIVNSILAKNQFEKEKAEERRLAEEQKAKAEFVSNYIGSPTGGSPYAKDMITGYVPIEYDPETGKATNFPYAGDRPITTSKDGGIARLNMGGTLYQNNMMKLPVKRAMGGESTGVPGLTGNMSSKQMMNKIEDNPGITAFFPPKMGMINGPGGPKDDKIPAMLSDGEFVFTAKAVDNAGGPRAMYKMMNKLDPESSKGRGII